MNGHDRMALAEIEDELGALSAPASGTDPGEHPWRAAARREGLGRRWHSFSLESRVPAGVLAAAAVLLITAVVVVPNLGQARSSAVGSAPSGSAATRAEERLAERRVPRGESAPRDAAAQTFASVETPDVAIEPRAVIRRATVALRVEDVQTAYTFAAAMVEETLGEYIEKASLSGSGAEQRAELTLRVRASKLDETLERLRELGEVTNLNVSGEDVTDRAVDLEARLRNETRIEAEVLELLASREDASLDEVFSVRQRLDGVRERIERLTAQRDALTRRVALATVTVTLRPQAEPPAPVVEADGATWWEGTRALFAREFGRGGDEFVRSLAWLVRVGLGGAIVWIPLAGLGAWAWLSLRRARARAGYEPAPSLD